MIYDVDGSTLDVKRFSLPLKIELKCPYCQATVEHDFMKNSLYYPKLNKPDANYGYCTVCDNNFDFDVTLKISLEIDTDTRKQV